MKVALGRVNMMRKRSTTRHASSAISFVHMAVAKSSSEEIWTATTYTASIRNFPASIADYEGEDMPGKSTKKIAGTDHHLAHWVRE